MEKDLKTLQQSICFRSEKSKSLFNRMSKKSSEKEVLYLAVLGFGCDSTIMTRHTKFKATKWEQKKKKPLNALTAHFLESLYDVFKEQCDDLVLF